MGKSVSAVVGWYERSTDSAGLMSVVGCGFGWFVVGGGDGWELSGGGGRVVFLGRAVKEATCVLQRLWISTRSSYVAWAMDWMRRSSLSWRGREESVRWLVMVMAVDPFCSFLWILGARLEKYCWASEHGHAVMEAGEVASRVGIRDWKSL